MALPRRKLRLLEQVAQFACVRVAGRLDALAAAAQAHLQRRGEARALDVQRQFAAIGQGQRFAAPLVLPVVGQR